MSITSDFSFGVSNPTIDDLHVKPYPAVILQGTELGGVTSEVIEAAGNTWIVTNAVWNAPIAGFVQQNVSVGSSALVTTPSGQVTVYTAPAGASSPIVWTGVQNLTVGLSNPYYANLYGMSPTNTATQNSMAFQALLNLVPVNAVILIPPGTYALNATALLSVQCSIMGFGGRDSVILTGAVSGPIIRINGLYGGIKLSGLRIVNTGTGGCVAGYGTNAIIGGVCQQSYGSCGDITIVDCYMVLGGADAIYLNNCNGVYVTRTNFTVGSGGNGLHLTGCGKASGTGLPQNGVILGYTLEIHVTDCVIGGTGSASDTTSAGIRFDGYVDGVYVENTDIFDLGHSYYEAPNTQTATYVDSGAVVNTYTFNGFVGDVYTSTCTLNTSASNNLVVQPADATSVANGLQFSNCQIAGADLNTSTVGVLLDAYTNGGTVSGVMFTNCSSGKNSLHGVQIRGCSNVTWVGGYISGNQRFNVGGAFEVVLDGAASSNVSFSNVNMTNPFNMTFPAGYNMSGLFVGNYAHTNISFNGCAVTGTGYSGGAILSNNLPLAQQETGQLQVRNCPGINPIGSGAYLSGSLATGVARYNIAPATNVVTVAGGTVTVIAVNGITTGLTSGTFPLEPGETIAITYSVAPTITQKVA